MEPPRDSSGRIARFVQNPSTGNWIEWRSVMSVKKLQVGYYSHIAMLDAAEHEIDRWTEGMTDEQAAAWLSELAAKDQVKSYEPISKLTIHEARLVAKQINEQSANEYWSWVIEELCKWIEKMEMSSK